jgi:two-component system, response regulator PdtaR
MPSTSPLRVLLVASEFVIPLDIKRVFEQLGHQVCALARDADVGFRMGSKLNPDLALIDISSDVKGIQLAKKLRDHSGTPVIFVGTSVAGSTAAQIQKELPGAPVLQRPVSTEELAKVIGSVKESPRLLHNEDFEILLRFTREPEAPTCDSKPDITSTIFDPYTAERLRLLLLGLDGDRSR